MTTILTLENLQDMLEKPLQLALLPKVFRDAVSIARWMEVDYIWIDALCIVQNSPEDWSAESSKMYQYYTHTYCNIAATSAEPNKGCFTSRHVSTVQPYVINNPRSPSEIETHVIGYDDFWCNSLLDTDLHKRGWVLQERLLSPRTIHFGQEQIFWECRQNMACEAYPGGLPEPLCNHRTRRWRQADGMLGTTTRQRPSTLGVRKFLARVGLYRPTTVSQSPTLYSTWSGIVEAYMDCQLSFGRDKLVAISGLADKFSQLTGHTYLAGLWDNELLAPSLLWYVLGRRQADSTPSVRAMFSEDSRFRGPSWSWASMEARIVARWTSVYGERLLEITKTSILSSTKHSFGMVQDARMEVRGIFLKASISLAKQASARAGDEDGRYALKLDKKHHLHDATNAAAWTEPIIFLDTALRPRTSLDVWILPVCSDWHGFSGVESIRLAGLLLTRANAEAAEFTRLGVFGMDDEQASMLHSGIGIPHVFSTLALRQLGYTVGVIK
jgi:hypothetical protein